MSDYQWLLCDCGSGQRKNECACGKQYDIRTKKSSCGRLTIVWLIELKLTENEPKERTVSNGK